MQTRIGPYDIRGEIGRGGMGVVYRAHDARLGRDVAIKALPTELAADPDRLDRFEREARTLAVVSHTNLAGIFGIEEEEGAKYLVLEYVGGETLADRLDRGPVPPDEAIEYAAQIAAGVEAAHAAGIIHRDLKPANIKITPDGVAKVLDFGLARADDTGISTTDVAVDAETVAASARPPSPTIEGAILGTAAYMSPEQARGRRVDKRTDVWSFGVVLYEMLIGASPFVGETASDSIGAVLHKELDLSRLPTTTPPRVRRVLERCLVRDKSARYRDIGDLRLELLRPEADVEATATKARSPLLVPLLVLGAAALGAAAAWVLLPRPAIAPRPILEADIALPTDEMLAHGFMPNVAFARDGQAVAFTSGAPENYDHVREVYFPGRLMVRRLDAPEPVPVPGSAEEALQPTFSPDGSAIAYVTELSAIERIATAGGQATRLFDAEDRIYGLAWSDDGRIIFGGTEGLRSIPAAGGVATTVTTSDPAAGEGRHAFPHVLPDGRGIVYTVITAVGATDLLTVHVLDTTTSETHLLLERASHAQYVAGHLVFARDATLHAVPLDVETLQVTGDPRPVGLDVVHSLAGPNSFAMNGAAQFAVSPSGDLVHAAGTFWPELKREVVWVDQEGNATPIEISPGSYGSLRVSPDGRRLLASDLDSSIWVHELERNVTRRAYRGSRLRWSMWGPGAQEITFSEGDESGRFRVGWIAVGSTADPTWLPPREDERQVYAAEWSPDRRHLLCLVLGDQRDLAVWSEAEGWTDLTNDEVSYRWPTFSPDGRWIACASAETGRPEVYVRPFLRDGPIVQVTGERAVSPVWSRDGTTLFYHRFSRPSTYEEGDKPDRIVRAVPVLDSDGAIDFGTPVTLFDAKTYGGTIPLRSWDVAADGRFVMTSRPSEEDLKAAIELVFPDRLRLIQNWASRLQPTEPTR